MTIEKSLFIGYATPIDTEEQARAFIQEIKKKHRDATHNVSAYVLGEQSEIQRASDDGEPAGTAGVPVLEVLRKEDLQNAAVVVTRYFGGIKLGAGGLIRAYTKGAKIALEAAGLVLCKRYEVVSVTIAYPLAGMLQNLLEQNGYAIKEIHYTDKVALEVWVEAQQTDEFAALCVEWTNGALQLQKMGQAYRQTRL